MLEKKVIIVVAVVAAAAVAYMGYAIYKNYPETTTNNKPEGADA